uniref:Secreted protein n=1 Tax=Octopus bimaculoides TaxID=37653 RepID=A0A0L8GGC0_OCTBM
MFVTAFLILQLSLLVWAVGGWKELIVLCFFCQHALCVERQRSLCQEIQSIQTFFFYISLCFITI